MTRLNGFVVIICFLFVFAGQSCADVILTGAGATFPYPLYKKWFEIYQAEKNVRFSYRQLGSGGGIKQLMDKTVDFGATDAFLSDREEQLASTKVLHIPTCVGAVAIIYNLPVYLDLKLTPECIADIFLGRITKWSDKRIAEPNQSVQLPNIDITVIHRSDSSGTSFIFTDYLSKVNPQWRSSVGAGKTVRWPTGMGVERNSKVSEFVAKIPGGIGYVQLNYARNMNLPFVAVQNRSGNFVKPSLPSVSAAAKVNLPATGKILITATEAVEGYPISAFTYLIFYQEQAYQQRELGRAQALAEFLWWALHNGQEYNEQMYYARLPEEAVETAEKIVRSMTFKGQPLSAW